eukprot:TRINITY_DN6076_c2_g2_i2.p1 TRINITY_DN6076_c2_g2~~TRINITY_DN6076_c2_g2_i2.p1  ORF type:complete len:144 (+),score=14.74 TRINITY_DN6076_c2_g2_i2:360-791(+)
MVNYEGIQVAYSIGGRDFLRSFVFRLTNGRSKGGTVPVVDSFHCLLYSLSPPFSLFNFSYPSIHPSVHHFSLSNPILSATSWLSILRKVFLLLLTRLPFTVFFLPPLRWVLSCRNSNGKTCKKKGIKRTDGEGEADFRDGGSY